MRQRPLGRTGLAISEIGFGCGNVGGLMIRGQPRERVRAVARAIELGITYFDTAAQYGDGLSERHLGRALAELRAEVLVGTKINVSRDDLALGPARLRALLEAGLRRLGREAVDILFYHGRVRAADSNDPRGLTAEELLGPLLDGFRSLQRDGLTRYLGFTGLGDTAEVAKLLQPGGFDVFHCYLNAVNPSAGYAVPASFGPQHLGQMIDRAAEAGVGVFAIRVLAAGALAGTAERHPVSGSGTVLVGGTDFAADAARAERLRPLARELGIALPELALRFVLSTPAVASALVGFSSLEQVELAARAARAGPLPPDVVERIVQTATRA